MITADDDLSTDSGSFENTFPVAFAGRMPELEWIADGIQKGAHLLLQGEPGMGKTALVERAVNFLREKGPARLFRLDATQPPAVLADQLHSWAELLAGRPDRGVTSHPPLSVFPGNQVDPFGGEPNQTNGDLVTALQRLDRWAGQSPNPIGVCFDGFKNVDGTAAQLLTKAIAFASTQLKHLGLLVTTAERNLPFAGDFVSRELRPVEAISLAKSIAEPFNKLGGDATGVGEACVQLGGPRTSEIIRLAEQTFERAKLTGENGARAVYRTVQEKGKKLSAGFAQTWANLSEAERNLLGNIVKSVEGLATPQNLAALADGSRSAASLIGRGLLGQLPGGIVYIIDTAFRDWTGQMSMHLNAAADLPANQPKSLHFNFGVEATATRGPAIAR